MKKKNQWIIQDIYSGKSKRFNLVNKGPSGFCFANLIKNGLTVLISVLVIFTIVKAGTITPPGGAPAATFYTLSEIYTRLTTNATTTEEGHSFTFSDAATGTHYTLTQIYNVIPTIDAAKVFFGTSYLGVAGALTLACATSTFDGTGNLVLDTYDGAGNGANRWCMATSTNSAAASQILSGYKSWANGIELTGSISTQTLSAATTTVSAGYYNATTVDAVDVDLAAGNIKSGVNIFGVNGNVSASYDYAPQRYQVYDDWNCSNNNEESSSACAAGDAEYTGEEGTWTLNTDVSPPAGIASGKVYRDVRTLLYWSDYFTTATSNSFTIDCTDAAINNGTCDYNSYATTGNAITLCKNLSLDSTGGGKTADWRLPSQKELMQAYIDGAANNLPNPNNYFWSSTEDYNSTANAWYVYLYNGYTNYGTKTITRYVRCVRL